MLLRYSSTSCLLLQSIDLFNFMQCQGEIALAFGDLLRKLWAPGATPVAPRTFKSKLSRFAPQFNGFNQHDSQVSEVYCFQNCSLLGSSLLG